MPRQYQQTYNCFKTYFSIIFTKRAFYSGYKNFDRLTFNRGIGEKLNQQTNELRAFQTNIYRSTEYLCINEKEIAKSYSCIFQVA